ncbi:MAG: hypothetical protein DMD63_04075 [Gemmatimonadetes bacterium]|nr:MAG: hypothetical protein DMD63_04075 [Gemmatimonadota bacterium]
MTGISEPLWGSVGGNPEFEAVASLSDLGDGTVVQRVRSSGDAICLVRLNGEISALSDICTHQHFSMSLGDLFEDGTLQCAWHGTVRLEGEQILVGPRCARINGKYESSTVRVP